MKNIVTLLLLLSVSFAKGQDVPAYLSNEVPDIFPPSPTVSALMRFEEIPVNNYTGVPDINIPVFSTKTHSPNVQLNLSLNYHPSAVAAEEIAPDTGLGWSLFAGGVISRTVRGLPDEYLEYGSGSHQGKVGIYQTTVTNYVNYYHKAESILLGGPDTGFEDEEFKWDSHEKGKYDTEHDLYQFNFMGITGRFFIKKNMSTQQLEVIPLDDDTQNKIEFDYSFNSGTKKYTFKKFTITDDQGTRYVFDEIEMTTATSSVSWLKYFGGITYSSSASTMEGYASAFHLSKIYDTHNNLLVSFSYTSNSESHFQANSTKNTLINGMTIELIQFIAPNDFIRNSQHMEPEENIATTTKLISAKKLQQIAVEGLAKISFTRTGGRTDTNLPANSGAQKLTEITIRDWKDNLIKKTELLYDYFTVPYQVGLGQNLKRLVLKEVREYNSNLSDFTAYNLDYKTKSNNQKKVIKDPWGYFELESKGYGNISDKEYGMTGVLEKMHLPTGGYIGFDFEPNTYSYIGNEPLQDFDENPENFTYDSQQSFSLYLPTTGQNSVVILDNTSGTYHGMELEFDLSDFNGQDDNSRFWIEDGNGDSVYTGCNGEQESCFSRIEITNGIYTLYLNNDVMDVGTTVRVVVKKYKRAGQQKEYVHGGGIRIKRVSFFGAQTTRKNYSYNFFSDASKSSGALVFAKPVYEFEMIKNTHFIETFGLGIIDIILDMPYRSKTTFNSLSFLRTQGSDVGYKNVQVKDMINLFDPGQENGRSEYEYYSPIDYPETSDVEDYEHYNTYIISYPYLPSKNFDYKRGLLQESRVYDQTNRIVKKTTNNYDFANENLTMTGIKISMRNNGMSSGCAYAYMYTFTQYLYYYQNWPDPNIPWEKCGYPAFHLQMFPMYEASGWAQLKSSTTKDYFYNGSIQNEVSTVTHFTYNTVNKRLQTRMVNTHQGESVRTQYLYPQDLASEPNMPGLVAANRIADPVQVATYKVSIPDETRLSTQKAVFENMSGKILPRFVQASKGNNPLLSEVSFDSYDQYGNPTQVSRIIGPKTSYIYGYNNQYPVAKIEGATYTQATGVSGLNMSVINNPASDAALRTEINKIRTALNGAMVTGYTYAPLKGVTSVTDPKGDTTYYHYDAFSRLQYITDTEGHVLEQYEYNYGQ